MRAALADAPKRVNAALHNLGSYFALLQRELDKPSNSPRYASIANHLDDLMKLLCASLALGAAALTPYSSAFAQTEEPAAIALKKAQKKQQAADQIATVDIELPRQPESVVQTYDPSPAIWKLSDEDTTIYMFGTFHILPKGFRWRSPAFNTIVAQVDELVVETSDDDSDAQIESLVGELVMQSLDPNRVSISNRLSEKNREKWFRIGESAGLPRDFFDRMPIIFSMLSAGIEIAEDQGSLAEYGVETILEAEFKAANRPIGSIEDSSDVMRAMLAINEDIIVRDMDEELSKWDGKSLETLFEDNAGPVQRDDEGNPVAATKDPFESEHAWAQGESEKLSLDGFEDTEFGREMQRVLITDRNRAWATWLDSRLDRPGVILLAVGAGHFAGAGSVQSVLKERGLTAERIH